MGLPGRLYAKLQRKPMESLAIYDAVMSQGAQESRRLSCRAATKPASKANFRCGAGACTSFPKTFEDPLRFLTLSCRPSRVPGREGVEEATHLSYLYYWIPESVMITC